MWLWTEVGHNIPTWAAGLILWINPLDSNKTVDWYLIQVWDQVFFFFFLVEDSITHNWREFYLVVPESWSLLEYGGLALISPDQVPTVYPRSSAKQLPYFSVFQITLLGHYIFNTLITNCSCLVTSFCSHCCNLFCLVSLVSFLKVEFPISLWLKFLEKCKMKNNL